MDNFPTCQVCQQLFTLNGPFPYLLPCLHAVCETCVTSADGGVMSCSMCQSEVNLAETLQKDVVRQREIFHLTVQHRPSELLCSHEDDGNQAVCWCQECEEFLCEHCQNMHESFKATKRHAVQEIADIQAGSMDHEEYCSIHKAFPLDMWDRNCNSFVCAKCRRADHAEHDVNYIDVASDTSRIEMEAQEKEVQRVGDAHSLLLQMTTKQLDTANGTYVFVKDVISHKFHSLKTMLDQREKELYVSLQQHTDRTKSDLVSKITVAQSNHLRCNVALEYVKKFLLYSTKYDLLKIKKMVGETTHSCIASEPPEEREDLPLPVFQTENLDNLKSTLSSFGEIATMRNSSSQNQFFEDRASQERADNMTKLDEMENEYKKKLKQLEDELITSKAKVDDVIKKKEEAERDAKEANEQCKKFLDEKKMMERENATLKEAIKSLEKSVKEKKISVKRLQKTLREIGWTFDFTHHLLKTDILDKSFILQCIHLRYDLDRVNISGVHIDNNGVLVNRADKGLRGHPSRRFQNYWGTTSTVPLPQTGHPQYMEVVCDVGIDKPLETLDLVLELGVCREEEMDVGDCIPVRKYCYSLYVTRCSSHNSLCTCVRKDGKVVQHVADTLPNTVGSQTTLHYGMVYDSNGKVIIFIDVKGMKTIKVLDNVNWDKLLWPMFGVYPRVNTRTGMQLVVGKDIHMTPEKIAMILKAL